ncbi:dihydrolipoamide succinyltransferase [Bacillus pseudomycoides]|nr:dihydrolipoamide succinyltransferase [Bacillus pseudomycoides]
MLTKHVYYIHRIKKIKREFNFGGHTMDFFMTCEIDKTVKYSDVKLIIEVEKTLKKLENNHYGNEIESISIIPIIIEIIPELEDASFFKERKLFKRKNKEADMRLRINIETFLNADRARKKLLIVKNVIECVRILGTKAKKDFDAERLENDILNLFEVEKGVIDNIDM